MRRKKYKGGNMRIGEEKEKITDNSEVALAS